MTASFGLAGGWHIKQKPLQGLLGTGGGLAVGGKATAAPTPIEYIVIGGGGGAGQDAGGGGGAGGYLTGTTPGAITKDSSLSITVGGGGFGGGSPNPTNPTGQAQGGVGANSVFDNPYQTITCYGGGFGGGSPVVPMAQMNTANNVFQSFHESKTLRIECLLDTSFNHLSGKPPKNIFEKMLSITEDNKYAKNETTTRVEEGFLHGYYDYREKKYIVHYIPSS